ncbi:MAG: DUF2391 family protein [Candidatus Woesearchaeota archaeon]|nr:DUF2391 family protein [Candidatus Woesearchaeota archaeon]
MMVKALQSRIYKAMAEDKSKEKLREDVKRILSDIEELNKDLGETGEEIEETGEDVEEIKEEVGDIKKEVGETGEDVEEIKEHIEGLKEDIGTLSKTMFKGKQLFSRVATRVLPDKFAFKDIAQQIVGATILSAPFAVTEEVWTLAKNLDGLHIVFLIILTIFFDVLLFNYTKYQNYGNRKLVLFLRITSLMIVTYVTSGIVLSVFGVIGGRIIDPFWAMRLIVMVGLFANIGASTADLIK